jgi:predicted O-methyltransferase YrrM
MVFAEWLSGQVKSRDGAYVDIGGFNGTLAAAIARASPDRPVIVFEPVPETALQAQGIVCD